MDKKIPFKTIQHVEPTVNRFQGFVQEAFARLNASTLDDHADGTQFKRVMGVSWANQVTSSGIAPYTILSTNIASGTILGMNVAPLTISGANLTNNTVTLGKLGTANQFSVYRDAAFTCPNGAYSIVYCNKIVKDVAGGYDSSTGIYTIPSGGDWAFNFTVGLNMVSTGHPMYGALVINSGNAINGSLAQTSGATQLLISAGTFLHVNALAGDKVRFQVFNGDNSGTVTMSVASGANYFQGYQLR